MIMNKKYIIYIFTVLLLVAIPFSTFEVLHIAEAATPTKTTPAKTTVTKKPTAKKVVAKKKVVKKGTKKKERLMVAPPKFTIDTAPHSPKPIAKASKKKTPVKKSVPKKTTVKKA